MPTKIKTNRKVRSKKLLEVPTAWLSIVCRCSPDLIRRYRRGSLTGNGIATSWIRSADELLAQKIEALLLETGVVVNHTPKPAMNIFYEKSINNQDQTARDTHCGNGHEPPGPT